MKRVSRGAIFWGSALIAAGATILLIQQGYVDEQLLSDASQWWPLLIIGAGVAIIFAGVLGSLATGLAGLLLGVMVGALLSGATSLPTSCSGEAGPLQAFQDGSFDGPGAQVIADLSCVTLEVSGTSASDWAVEADEDTQNDLDLQQAADGLELRTNNDVTLSGRRHVAITVPRDDATNLDLSLNAGEATVDLADGNWGTTELTGNATSLHVDLSDAKLDSLAVSLNAGSSAIQLSDRTSIGSVDLSANAGSIEVCAPDGVGLQVTMGSDIAVGNNLDDAGFTQNGDTWKSPGYDSAETQIEVSFSGNAASFTVNPEGGCS